MNSLSNNNGALLFEALVSATMRYPQPFVHTLTDQRYSLFNVIAAALITARATDIASARGFSALCAIATTAEAMRATPLAKIERALRGVNYYKTKARNIKEIARALAKKEEARMRTKEALCALPGVGGKTANLVLGVYFEVPAIAVDTHVMRIAGRLGLCPLHADADEVEGALMEYFPREYWIAINDYGVRLGKYICQSRRPRCSVCPLRPRCPQCGVTACL